MICDQLICLPIPQCLGELTIGVIGDHSQSISIYIRDITTGLLQIFQSTSDVNGIVKVDLTEIEFSDLHTYEIWITLAGLTPDDRTTITVGDNSSTLLLVTFERVMDNDIQFSFPSVILKS